MSENKKNGRLLFRLIKGFLYGSVIGLIFGTSVYLLADAVSAISQLPWPAGVFAALIFGASTVAGTAHEYSEWLEQQ